MSLKFDIKLTNFKNFSSEKVAELDSLSVKILLLNYLTFISGLIYSNFYAQAFVITLIVSLSSLIYLVMKGKVNLEQKINLLSLTAVIPLLLPLPIEEKVSVSLAIFSLANWNNKREDIYHQFLRMKEEKISEMKRELLQGSKIYKRTMKKLNKLEKRLYELYQKLQIFYIIQYFLPILTLPLIKSPIAYVEGLLTILSTSFILSLLLRNSLFDYKHVLYLSLISLIIRLLP